MATKILAALCIQMAIFNVINAQCLNRILPAGLQGLSQNILPVAETIVPNQIIYNSGYPGAPVIDMPYQPYGLDVIPNQILPATTVIQDSTVANNLANALQLLVVSNLLSNTLPTANDFIPNYAPQLDYGVMSPGIVSPGIMSPGLISPAINPCGLGGYNYIY